MTEEVPYGKTNWMTEAVSKMDSYWIKSEDWLVVTDPKDNDTWYKFHLPFLFSNWNCLYGKGCPGGYEDERGPAGADVGCCMSGAFMDGDDEYAEFEKNVALLTEEDLHPKALAYVRKHGGATRYSKKGEWYGKTKTRNRACVFVNRANEAPEGEEWRTGCAFLHLSARLNKNSVENVDHTDRMPVVCWQLPFKMSDVEDEDGGRTVTILPWDASRWNLDENCEDMRYWCVNDKAAYSGQEPLYRSAKNELVKMIGLDVYEAALPEFDKRYKANYVEPMPAAGPEGRTMLPITEII